MCGRLVNLDTVARVLAEYYHLKTDTQLAALDEALSKVPAVSVGGSHGKDHVADPGKMVGDLISRADKELFGNSEQLVVPYVHYDDMIHVIKHLPSAQPEQHGRIFKGIVVEYPSYNTYPEYKGKPYFSIKYTENGQEFIGYGTYKPEVLSEYLKEYFMPSAQPDIILCPNCRYNDGTAYCELHYRDVKAKDFCSWAERRE